MINLILDKKGGINKGDIDIFETENKNEVYVIQLTKNGEAYNLTGKTVELSIIEKKRKYGDMLQLQVEDAVTGKVRLEIVSDITKQDGAYDFQLTVKGADGFIELFPVFRVDIKNNISTDLSGTIVSSPSFTILNDKLQKVTEWDAYFAETSGKLEEKYTTRLNELNTSLETIANKQKVSILDYGAKGDGVTNDYNAFLQAKAKVGVNGVVYFPETTVNKYYMSNGQSGNLGRISAIDFPCLEFANPNITLKYYYDPDLKYLKTINKFKLEWNGNTQVIDNLTLTANLSKISSSVFNPTQALTRLNFTSDFITQNFNGTSLSNIVGLSNYTSQSMKFDKETSGTNLIMNTLASGKCLEVLLTKDSSVVTGGFYAICVKTNTGIYIIQLDAVTTSVMVVNKYVSGTPTGLYSTILPQQYRMDNGTSMLFEIKNVDNTNFEISLNGYVIYKLNIGSDTYEKVGVGHARHLNGMVTLEYPVLISNYFNPNYVSYKYFAFGDSITFGAYAYKSYPDMIADILYKKKGIRELRVDNRGFSGDNSAQCLARVNTSLIDMDSKSIVTIQIGTNDCIGGVALDTYISNMTQIIDNVRTKTQKLVISTFPFYSTSIANYNKIALYNARLRQLCIDKNVKLVDNMTNYGYNLDLLPDGIHPDVNGLQLLAKGFSEGILEIYNV